MAYFDFLFSGSIESGLISNFGPEISCLKRALSFLSQQHQQLIIISSSSHHYHHHLHLISSCKRLTKLKFTLCGTGSRWNWTVEDVANSNSSSSISSCMRVLSRSQTCCLLPGAWQLCGFLCLSHGEVRVISMLTLNFLLQLRSGCCCCWCWQPTRAAHSKL